VNRAQRYAHRRNLLLGGECVSVEGSVPAAGLPRPPPGFSTDYRAMLYQRRYLREIGTPAFLPCCRVTGSAYTSLQIE
jgi:hypothetical protein